MREDPYNIDAEKSALSACVLSDTYAEELVKKLSVGDFYRVVHQVIFRAIQSLVERGKPVDHITLADELQAEGELEKIGGKAYLIELCDNTFALLHVKSHAEIILRCSRQRALIRAAQTIEALAMHPCDNIDALQSEAIQVILDAVMPASPDDQ